MPCVVFINVSLSLIHRELLKSRMLPRFSLHLPQHLLSGVLRAERTQESQTGHAGPATASRLSLLHVFVSFTDGF